MSGRARLACSTACWHAGARSRSPGSWRGPRGRRRRSAAAGAMTHGVWRLELAVQGDGWPKAVGKVVEAAVRLGLDAADRPIRFGLQPVLELGLALTHDVRIRELNREHRGIDEPTDVLSFSQVEGSAGFVPAPSGRLALGDVIVSLDTARCQAAELGHGLDQELCLL